MAALAIWILCVCCIIPIKVRGSLEEEGEEQYVYVYVGEALRINCSLPADSPRPVSSLNFTLENGLCESNPDYQCDISGNEVRKVGERTVQLTRTIRVLQDAGRYTCWHQFHTIIQDLLVYVQYRPQSAEGLHCEAGYSSDRSDHIDQLTCHWRHPLTYNDHSDMAADVLHDMTVTAALRPLHSEGPAVQYPHPLSTQDSQCQWAGVHFHPASRYTLQVNVTNTEKHDTAVAAVVITLRDIVKASPVKSVRIKDENSTCVTVTLTHARARDTLYTVTVATKKNTTLVKSHTGRDSEVTLCGLEPYTSYTLSVKCRAADRQGPHGLWSDTKSEPVFTREAAPGASFQVHEGSYVRDQCDEAGIGDVMILWKAVDPGSRHGVINGYRLVYNATTTLEVVTLSPPPTSALLPRLPCSLPVIVRIYSRTKAGFSEKYSSIRILPESPTSTVADFAVNIDGDIDGGRVLAVWNTSRSVSITSHTDVITDDGDVGEDDVDNNDDESRGQQSRYGDEVTVFRCLKNKTAIVPTCQGEVDWNTAPLSAGQLDLTPYFSQGSNPHAYLFGTSRGAHSIQWTSCLFPGNGEMHPPREVGAGEGGVEVRWRRQQCSPTYPVHVTGYRLHICPTQRCPDMGRTVDVEGWESDHCPVEAGEDYVIKIQTLGHGGRLGPLSAPVSVTVPRLESRGLYIWLILGICTMILVVLLVLLVKCCRNSLRQREQKFAKPEDLLKHQGMDMEGHAERNGVDIQASRDRGEQPTAPPSSSLQPSSSSPSHSHSSTTTTTVLTKATGGGARMDSPPASPAPAARGPRKPGHGDLWRSPQLRVSSQDLVVFHAHVAAPDEENKGRPSSNSDGATVSLLPVSERFHVPEEVVDLQDCESEEMVFEDAERPLMPSSEAEGPGTLAMRHVDDAAHRSSDRPGYTPWPHRDSRAQNDTTTC